MESFPRSNVGILAGQVKRIRLHTHELEDHVVYVVRGPATARLGDERREVGPAWEPLNDTKFLE